MEYETAYFIGETDSVSTEAADYTWSVERHTSGSSGIYKTDIDGVNAFNADDERIYMDGDQLFFRKYNNESLRMVKVSFQSFDECIDYYNVDYGKNFSDGALLRKHGINDNYKGDEYWYYSYEEFTDSRGYKITLQLSDMWDGEFPLMLIVKDTEENTVLAMYCETFYGEVGDDGEFIYYPARTFWNDENGEYSCTLKYFPEDHHIAIESDNETVDGEYWTDK